MVPRDCYDIQQLCGSKSGHYFIFPHINDDPLEVYCDMKTDNGGWLVSELEKQSVIFTGKFTNFIIGIGIGMLIK